MEVLVSNPLPWPFASIGISPTDIVQEPEVDLTPSSSPTRSYLKDEFGSDYINASFHDELKKIGGFEVKFSF